MAAGGGKITRTEAKNATVDSAEILNFLKNEMAEDARRMSERRRFTERLLSHDDVQVAELKTPTIDISKPFSEAKKIAGFETAVNADTGVEIAISSDGYKETRNSINKLAENLKMPAIAALENFNVLMPNSVYVGSYTDYGNSQNMTAMHCFVAPFEYDGTEYRAIYSAKETRNNDGSYSTKLYLQRVEALKAQKNVVHVEDRTVSSNEAQRSYYINDTTDTSISASGDNVNTIPINDLLEGYNLSALKAWPLAKIDVEERRAGDADSGWGRKADEVRRINHAVKVFNGIYEELYNMVNDAYVRNGYEKMGRRKNYFPHFQEEESNLFENFARKLGFGAGKYALPTSIDGLTETFSPGRNYNKHAEHRLGTDTAFDAIAGFEDYIESATKAAYLTDDIKRLRQLEREIRAGEQIGTLTSRTKLSKANGDFGSLAKWVHEYANLVAGKKSSLDRGVENVVGRRVYQVLDTIRSRRGAAAVAGNISSALTNIAPVVQVISEHPIATVKGMMGMMCDLMRGGDTPESRFLTRRFASDQLGVGRLARIEKIASKPFEIVDTIASNIVVRGYYQSNIDAGMEPEAAMLSADAQAARLMADRSLGQMPNVYSSKLFMGVLGQFQLEVANNLKWMKDITRTYSPGRAAAILTLLAVMSKLTNEAWKQLTGRELMLDPISAVQEGVSAGREAAQQGGAWQGLWKGVSAGLGELMGNLPYISGGRIGTNLISDAIDAVGTIKDAAEEGSSARAWDTAFWQMMNYITYGGQIKKSYQGEGALLAGGVYNKNGQLMYPVDASDTWTRVQTLIFGKSSTRYARMYWDEGRSALTADNTTKYQQLVEGGMSPGAAYETVYAHQHAGRLYNKIQQAEKAGDEEEAARLKIQLGEQLARVDYESIIPAGLEGEMKYGYAQLLKSAYMESGDEAFMPEYYKGEFTENGVKYKFTPESMERIAQAYSTNLEAQMAVYQNTWESMSEGERRDAYSKAKQNARAAAKKWGRKNAEYISVEEYEKRGYVAPENAESESKQPAGLTNPIADIYRAATGEGGDMINAFTNARTGETAATGAGLNEASSDGTAAGGAAAGGLSADEIKQLSNASTSKSNKSGSSGRRRSGGRKAGGSSMTVGAPTATVNIPWYKTRMYESFGAGYNPFPLTNSFEWGGERVSLSGEEMGAYSGLYDAYMDMYMRERQQEWDGSDSAGRETMLREMDERARDAAYQHLREVG